MTAKQIKELQKQKTVDTILDHQEIVNKLGKRLKIKPENINAALFSVRASIRRAAYRL